MRAGFLAAIVFAAGFFYFVGQTSPTRLPDNQKADAIVALTGGKARIGEAVKLLAHGKARRMLITGVNPTTKAKELERLVPRGKELFNCCIDLGREARDTAGNARETRDWAQKNGFNSLIVVTSSYHMPRALAELMRAMPGKEILPHAVEPRSFASSRWWRDRNVLKLMASEYLKYIPALARLAVSRLGFQVSAANASPKVR
jgi:uncharacterized SAM-binding protein YcdF (DUF218 family)